MSQIRSYHDNLTNDKLVLEADESAVWGFLVDQGGDEIVGDSWLWNSGRPWTDWSRSSEFLPGLPAAYLSNNQAPESFGEVRVQWRGLGLARQARVVCPRRGLLGCVIRGRKGGYSLFCRSTTPLASPIFDLPEVTLNEDALTSIARRLVQHGCFDPDEVALILTEDVQTAPSSTARISNIVRRQFEKKLAEEATWPDVVDLDRMREAMKKLEGCGVRLRLNWGHNRRHGINLLPLDESVAFSPISDIGNTIRRRMLSLSFVGQDSVELGHEVCKVLSSEGFAIEWSGDARQVIVVNNFHWQVRGVWKERSPDFEWRFSSESGGEG